MSNHGTFQASDPFLVRVAEGAFHGQKETHTVRKYRKAGVSLVVVLTLLLILALLSVWPQISLTSHLTFSLAMQQGKNRCACLNNPLH